MRMIWPVIQLPASHCIDKCRVIFERSSSGTRDYLRFRIILHQFRDQNMEGVSDSAALVVDDINIRRLPLPK